MNCSVCMRVCIDHSCFYLDILIQLKLVYEICLLHWECDSCNTLLNSLQDQVTALMLAAVKGGVGIVKMLIQHGANVNLTNKVTGP